VWSPLVSSKILPPLVRQTSIDRPLSVPEYYHASTGASPRSLDGAREVVIFLDGQGDIDPEKMQVALRQAAALNPGARLRMHGDGLGCRWSSDGMPTRFRLMDDLAWDGQTEAGAEFITALPLSLREGPSSELILARRQQGGILLTFRVLHAVMDGMGVLHFLHEVFRALRGEPLLGTNAVFSDTDIMRSRGGQFGPRHHTPAPVATVKGGDTGYAWRRLSLTGPRHALLARTALTIAEYARCSSDAPALIAVPVDLRRHVPGIHTTNNCTSMLHIEVGAQDVAETFRSKLRDRLDHGAETAWLSLFGLLKLLPLAWLDHLAGRRVDNFATKRLLETAVITNPGRFEAKGLSCDGFLPQAIFGMPVLGNTFCFMLSLDARIEIMMGMPQNMASDGRIEALMDLLKTRLEA
jgi:hypothetical protein